MAIWRVTYQGTPYFVDDTTGTIYTKTGGVVAGFTAARDANGIWHIYGPGGLDWQLQPDWSFYDQQGNVMATVTPEPYNSIFHARLAHATEQFGNMMQQQPKQQGGSPYNAQAMQLLVDSAGKITKAVDQRKGLFDQLMNIL